MGVFCVGYNLTNKARDYTDFFVELEKNGFARIHSGTCLVVSIENTRQLQERLRFTMDEDDSLFICRVYKDEYSGWATQSVWDWIKMNI